MVYSDFLTAEKPEKGSLKPFFVLIEKQQHDITYLYFVLNIF